MQNDKPHWIQKASIILIVAGLLTALIQILFFPYPTHAALTYFEKEVPSEVEVYFSDAGQATAIYYVTFDDASTTYVYGYAYSDADCTVAISDYGAQLYGLIDPGNAPGSDYYIKLTSPPPGGDVLCLQMVIADDQWTDIATYYVTSTSPIYSFVQATTFDVTPVSDSLEKGIFAMVLFFGIMIFLSLYAVIIFYFKQRSKQ